MTDVDINTIIQGGGTAALIAYLWLQNSNARRDAKESETRTAARIEANQQACEQREERLVGRVQALEDRHHDESARTLHLATEALRMNAEAFARLADSPSGQHQARRA